jgi:colanic acid biosynthesis glycosyl transferase WcaI
MKILALTRYFPPDIGTAAHLFFELCETLVQRGHEVTAVTTLPRYNLQEIPAKYRRRLFLEESLNGIKVLRIAGFPIPSEELRRKAEQILVALPLYWCGLAASRPDVIILYSPPLPLGVTAYYLSRKWRVPFVVNVQDLFPQCLADYGYSDKVVKLFGKMADFVYAKANYITVHSEGNRQVILRDSPGVPPEKIKIIDNWVDTDLIQPGERRNEFSAQHQLDDYFVVSFAGSIGVPQGLDVAIEAAYQLKDADRILFLIVGDGIRKDRLRRRAQELGLNNVRFLPMQPRDTYPWILASSEVCLVTLIKEISTPVIPSKILSIMAAGRPVLAGIPLKGDAPKLIEEAQCGLCVEPENPEALAQAILQLYHNPELREFYGRNGRQYAEDHLSREACVAKYEALFQEAVRNYAS